MRILRRAASVLAAMVVVALGAGEASAQQARGAQTAVQAAAQAMGGVQRLQGVRNITLHGYAQYAYQFGAGRITGEPEAPEKYIAANDLTRVYDLENNRYRLTERRNMLFPFLGTNMHNWLVVDQVLDGDFAYDNLPDNRQVRTANMSDGALWLDGVHVRRMWMVTNPVVMIRKMMDPATRLAAPRRQNGLTLVDATLATGDKFTAAFRADNLPAYIHWTTKHTNFGQLGLTVHYTGWNDATGNSGILLPLAYVARIDYRNVDYFKLYVDGYDLNTNLTNMTPTAATRALPEPASYATPTITSKQIGKGVWRVDQGGTMVIEFKDHLVIYELNVPVQTAKAIMAHARTLAPGKPITHYIASHNHLDHTMGLRQAVAENMTVVQRAGSETQFREMAAHPAPDYPDDQARARRPMKWLEVKDHLRMSDETQTIDIYAVPNNAHMSDAIVIHIPSEKLLMEGDLVTASVELQHWPDGFRDVIAKYNLAVDWVAPVHGGSIADTGNTGKFSREYAEKLLKEGTERARAHCQRRITEGTRHPGCPVQTKYY